MLNRQRYQGRAAGGREFDEDAPTIQRVRPSSNQAAQLHAVDEADSAVVA